MERGGPRLSQTMATEPCSETSAAPALPPPLAGAAIAQAKGCRQRTKGRGNPAIGIVETQRKAENRTLFCELTDVPARSPGGGHSIGRGRNLHRSDTPTGWPCVVAVHHTRHQAQSPSRRRPATTRVFRRGFVKREQFSTLFRNTQAKALEGSENTRKGSKMAVKKRGKAPSAPSVPNRKYPAAPATPAQCGCDGKAGEKGESAGRRHGACCVW